MKDLAGKSIRALQEYAAMANLDSAKRQCNNFIGMSVQTACQTACRDGFGQTSVTSSLITLARCVLLCQIRSIVAATFECAHCNKHILAFQEQTNSTQASLFFSAASKGCLSDIVSSAKEAVAKHTVELVIGETLSLQPTLSGILKKGIRQINSRDEIPCFYAIMALYTIAQSHNLAILVKVKKQEHLIEESPDSPFDVQYLYKPTKDGFVKSLQTPEDEGNPVIVIEGMRSGKTVQAESLFSYEKRLSEVPLLQLLQLNSAQHPQYSDKSFVIAGLEPQEQLSVHQLALQAQQIGCSNANESLFCITHIFADTLKKQLVACSSSNSATSSSATSIDGGSV